MKALTIRLHTSKLYDSWSESFSYNITIHISPETGLILSLKQRNDLSIPGEDPAFLDYDLRGLTVLPGFVDVHTHLLLHAYSETSWDDQVIHESITERTIRAVQHARRTLLAGYTTIRDLGTEGAQDVDIELRNSIEKGIIPGPRMFVASRGIVSTGSYGPRTENALGGVKVPCGAEIADGIEEMRKVVRRQLGAGADLIKLYGDYRRRTALKSNGLSTKNYPLFTPLEVRTAVQEATAVRAKVAVHAKNADTILTVVREGVSSIEHGTNATEECFSLMQQKGTVYVPTLAAFEAIAKLDPKRKADVDEGREAFKLAVKSGVKIACGGDTGVFAHGTNAREMEIMVEYGVPVKKVLAWGTLSGWELCMPLPRMNLEGEKDEEGIKKFGRIAEGWSADIIAVKGDLEKNFLDTVRNVVFVMKEGKVYKVDGSPIEFH